MSQDAVGQRSETVRRANLSAIVRELHGRGSLSRSELVVRTGLTRSAIRGLIGEFVAADLVTEERAAPLRTPGRPSPLVRVNPERAVVLALEIAVDSLAAAIVGLGGEVLDYARVDRPRDHTSVEAIVDDLADLSAGFRSRPSTRGALIGIGVSVAGIVRRSDGLVSMAPNLDWHDVALGQRLIEVFGVDVPISVANDGDLGAIAESRRGAAIGGDNVLFISGEVGVGGGLIVDGRPLTGAAGYGGEVGHMPVNPTGTACHCGSFGCWETEIGADALLRRAGHPVGGGRTGVEAVVAEALAGSPQALDAFEEVGRWLGFGLAGLVNVLNPRVVVLGGLFGRIHPFVSRALHDELSRRAMPATLKLVRVVPATLGMDAPLLGAAELAFEPLLTDPAIWLRPRDTMAELASA